MKHYSHRILSPFLGKIIVTFLIVIMSIGICRAQYAGLKIHYLGANHSLVQVQEPQKYLLLPVEEAAPEATVNVLVNNKADQSFQVRLAVNRIDYLVPFALEQYKGKTVTFDIHTGNSRTNVRDAMADACWKELKLSDTFDDANREAFRPFYHHTPVYGWMNDPNGMFYKDGEYHLYFQYNPYGSKWGNMHWGHSVSKDLVHWEHLAPAIARDTLGHIFSGSSIVDQENVAGYGAGNILAFYTSASDKNGQIQCLAFSKDNGRTFTKYEKNPILCPADGLRDFRDPKVFRYEPEDKWVMIVSADKEMRFYDSKNLKDWNYMSSFGEGYGVQPCQFECPDMVELPVDGDLNRKKWALIVNVNPGCYFGGSATQYFTGNFDGTKFSCDSQPNVTKWLDWGKDHYATVCFSNTGERTIAVPWMSNWQYCNIVPTKQFRSANALPRELSLYTQDGEIYLSAVPVPEIKTLRKEKKEIPAFTVANDYHIDSLLADNDGAYELALEITVGEAEIMGFNLFNDKGEKVDIYFNLPEKRLVMDRTKSGIVDFGKKSVSHEIEVHDRRKTTSINYIDDFALATWAPIKKENKYTLDVFVDKCSVEIFLNGGKVAMTNLIFPSEPYNRMCFYSKGGSFQVDSFKAYRLGL